MKATMIEKYFEEKEAFSDTDKAAKLLKIGINLYISGDLQQAYITLEEASKLNPNNNMIKSNFQTVKKEFEIPENPNNAQIVLSHINPNFNYVDSRTAENVFHYLNEKITNIEQKVDIHENRLEKTEEILDITGITRQAAVNNAINRLKNENIELYKYCCTFHYTMTALFEAYKTLGTGIVAAEMNKFEGMHCKALKIWGCYLANGAEMATTFVIPALGPFICSAHEFSTTIYEFIMGKKIDNRAECISKIIAERFEFYDKMHIELGELAVTITEANRDRILNPLIEDNKNFPLGLSYLKQKIFGTFSANEKDAITKFASNDVALFLIYLFENYELILENKELSFCKQIKTIFNTTNLLTDTYKEALKNFEPMKLIQNIIPKNDALTIENLTLQGKWYPEKNEGGWCHTILGWSTKTLGVSDFFKEEYVKKICQGNILSWKNDLAKVAILSKMCNALVKAKIQNLECVIEVSKNYPHVIQDMFRLCPEQFGNREIAKKSIENTPFSNDVKNNLISLSNNSFNTLLQLEDNTDILDEFHLMG